MKSTIILAMAFAAFSFTTVKNVDVTNSAITWVGHKVTGQHDGSITLKEGTLKFDDKEQLTGGSFIMDMTTLTVEDLEGESKGKLEGHLKSDDFFGVDNHKTSKFVITKVEGKNGKYKVTGDLTIKGISFPNTFDMTVNDNNTATAILKVDRTKYDIKFRSTSFFDGLADKAIYDNFDLNVNLKF
ncbi:YceI family protein [Gelidibacter salicanalis]|uniref:YceI family protein n=1 Tax=Gelidibacter salicanalis TaxID=291193 RepID=A0A934KW58_9FLAO|nr:YceI family protein [Gelidibacter salicanalis]MBJ7882401.1 YceI family protein [Gelidibacter salicanalis]